MNRFGLVAADVSQLKFLHLRMSGLTSAATRFMDSENRPLRRFLLLWRTQDHARLRPRHKVNDSGGTRQA